MARLKSQKQLLRWKPTLFDSVGRKIEASSIHEGVRPQPLQYSRNLVFESHTQDWSSLVSDYDWRTLLSVSRFLYSNNGPIRGALDDIATYSVQESWTPVFTGKDKEWGKQAYDWLMSWFSIYNVRGSAFDLWTDLQNSSVAIDRDGDILMVMTVANDGEYPLIQYISAPSIHSFDNQKIVEKGPFKGKRIKNGIILNKYGRCIGFQIIGEDEKNPQYISTENGILVFEPDYADQIRGLTALAPSITSLKDWRDIVDFERQKAKMLASKAIIVKNIEGGTDAADDIDVTDTSYNSMANYGEYLRGGEVQYFRAGMNEEIEAFEHNNPPQNIQDFLTHTVLRSAMAGIEWPLEMYDVSAMKSGPVRLIVAKAQRKITKRQATLYPMWKRIVGYGISKAIKLGLLPYNEDFLKWEPTYPPKLTIDLGREVTAEIELYKIGANTLSDMWGKTGEDWRTKVDQKIEERKYIKSRCIEEGLDPREVQILTPNANESVSEDEEVEEEPTEEDVEDNAPEEVKE